jgi:hypothetical protein
LFFVQYSYSQEKDSKKIKSPVDSLTTDLNEKGVAIDIAQVEKKEINPLAPSKAAFYSAVLPGLGQVYNKRYWKVPLAWGAVGGCIAGYSFNNTQYNRFREAFKRRRAGFIDEDFSFFSDTALQDAQERFQTDRDLFLLLTIVAYALNIVDANVDAHLKQYNVDEDLSLDFKPYFELNQITQIPNYGIAMTIKF